MKLTNTSTRSIIGGLLIAVFSLFTAGPIDAQVIIGNPADNGNEFPFGYPVMAYQQVYAASDFSGQIGITGITFFNKFWTSGQILSATYNIELSTTTKAVGALDTTFASNLGSDNTTVFNGVLSGTATPSFTIPTNLFHYNPGSGNLLLTIYQTNVTGSPESVFLDQNSTGSGLFSRVYSLGSTTSGTADNVGLVTQFDTAVAPEPSTWALLLVGLALICRIHNRKLVSQVKGDRHISRLVLSFTWPSWKAKSRL